jgi:outer membrane protein assembly factor BamA
VNSAIKGNKGNPEGSPRQLFDVPYFQYIRSDIDLRYYNVHTAKNMIVYRLYLGMGYAFGNSEALPYEKKFFSGGPNSIRAWSSRDLGPGSYSEPDSLQIFSFPNKTGDIKLEFNLEYRFRVVWKMESALFADVGNIWNLRVEQGMPGAEFRLNRLLSEMAVGTGFGIRFDFSFFLLRFDFGLKVHDPSLPVSERWLPVFSKFSLDDLSLKFGIGYPF